jgi:hypothetical protein
VTVEDIEMMADSEEGKAPLIFHHHLSLCIFDFVSVTHSLFCVLCFLDGNDQSPLQPVNTRSSRGFNMKKHTKLRLKSSSIRGTSIPLIQFRM